MAIAASTRFGAYEVTRLIGAGGMGDVYSARDTVLGREVAIKVLPEMFAADAGRVARFGHEAKTLASLNHPNIAQIFGLERSADGTLALAMELVEGTTLAERVAHGPVPPDEALALASQIADALEAAHERGIVHRDLKPANIKVRPDGTAKVLDFGIAKALDARVTSGAYAPALTTPAMTEAGIVLGTAAYMSPEQARGKRVDQRADIWAFGCVLYEMLTGRVAFGGDDVTIVLARVLERGVDLDSLPASVSPAVRSTLELCLEKDVKKRIADIRDVKLALEGRLAAPTLAAAIQRPWRPTLPLAAGALVAVGLLSGLAAWTLKPEPAREPRDVVRSTHLLPANVTFRNTARRAVAVSPDGRRFVYNGVGGLYLRQMDALDAQVIPGTEGSAFSPVFSPDGEALVYSTGAELRRIAVTGGPSVALAPAIDTSGFSWEKDGTILYATLGGGISQVSENGGDARQLIGVGGDELALDPHRLPIGDWILYTRLTINRRSATIDESEIVVQSPSSGERRTLRSGAVSARYLPTGHLVYGSEGVLYAMPFDIARLEPSGSPVPVVEGVRAVLQTGLMHFDVSRTGTLVYIPGPARTALEEYRIGVSDRTGAVTRVGAPGPYRHVRAAPDGKRVAIDTDNGDEAIVWIYDLGGATAMRRLTFDGRNAFPVWSPDNERVAFQSDREGSLAIFVQRVDGAGGARRLTTPEDGEMHVPESWSPDGRHLSFSVIKDGTFTLRILAVEDGTFERFGSVESSEPIGSAFSADGKWLAYHSLPPNVAPESQSAGVFVEPFPSTGARYQVPKVLRDFQPVWSRDGTDLHYIGSTASGQLATVRVSTESGLSFEGPTFQPFVLMADKLSGGTRAFDTLPDGRFVGLVLGPGETLAPQVRFVVDWFEELERLAPTR